MEPPNESCPPPVALGQHEVLYCGDIWERTLREVGYEPEAADVNVPAYAIGAVLIIMFAGIVAGLTMAIVSLDSNNLSLLIRTGTPAERKDAGRLKWFVDRHHLTLVTLLVAQSMLNEALPICLNAIVSESTAVVLSVTAVLIFGEVLPSAIMTGPRRLALAALMSPLVYTLIILLYLISKPLAMGLDWLIGDHSGSFTPYRRDELRELINMHGASGAIAAAKSRRGNSRRAGDGAAAAPPSGSPASAASLGDYDAMDGDSERLVDSDAGDVESQRGAHVRASASAAGVGAGGSTPVVVGQPTAEAVAGRGLNSDEVAVLVAALQMSGVSAADVMTPLDRVFCLRSDDPLDSDLLDHIATHTYSRIPVIGDASGSRRVFGILLAKSLVAAVSAALKPGASTVRVRDAHLVQPLAVDRRMTAFDLLRIFQTGRAHLAFVCQDAEAFNRATSAGLEPPPSAVRACPPGQAYLCSRLLSPRPPSPNFPPRCPSHRRLWAS